MRKSGNNKKVSKDVLIPKMDLVEKWLTEGAKIDYETFLIEHPKEPGIKRAGYKDAIQKLMFFGVIQYPNTFAPRLVTTSTDIEGQTSIEPLLQSVVTVPEQGASSFTEIPMLKVFLTTLDGHDIIGRNHFFLEQYEKFFDQVSLDECDIIFIVPVFHSKEYFLNTELAARIDRSKKPIAFFDYNELGWWVNDLYDHIFGINTIQGTQFGENELLVPYEYLSEWMRSMFLAKRVVAYFKRELHKTTREKYPDKNIYPIDWVNHIVWDTIDTEQEYNARPIEILFIFGQSHPQRMSFVSSVISFAQVYEWGICTDPSDIEHIPGKKVAMFHRGHWNRLSQQEMYNLQSQAKITVSMPGYGVKCFRDAEAPVNSLLAIMKTDIVRMIDWSVAGAVMMVQGKMFSQLENALSNSAELYSRYLSCVKQSENSKPNKIWYDYILPKLSKQ